MTFKIGSMDNVPDWLWHTSDASDWLGQGIVSRQGVIDGLVATGIVLGLRWVLDHRKEVGDFSNTLRYRLGVSPAPVIKTSSALSRISTTARAGKAQVRTVTLSAQQVRVTSSATGTLEVLRKHPLTKQEIYRIADTVLYYFT